MYIVALCQLCNKDVYTMMMIMMIAGTCTNYFFQNKMTNDYLAINVKNATTESLES